MFNNRVFVILLLTILTMVLLVSCSKETSSTSATDIDTVGLPDMIMTKSSYAFGEKGRRPVIMEADKILIYGGDIDKTILEGIKFFQEEKDEDGNTVIELSGSCDNAVVTGNNSFANLEGNVTLFKKSDNFTINCDKLVWDDENQKISTDSEVNVVYEDGTKIKAINFTALLDENVYEFGKIIEGTYESDK